MHLNKKYSIKNILLFSILFISVFLLIYSSYKIMNWYYEYSETKKRTKQIYDNVIIKEDINNEIVIKQEEINNQEDPYWSIINDNLLSINFEKLKQINSDLRGWVQLKGTNINYPYVQSSDNNYYLKKDFYKKSTNAGWIFQDYRNNGLDNKNTIIYGHSRLDNTMFGSLKNTLNDKWLNDKSNFIVKITTENEQTLWQVFSVYRVKNTIDYIKTDFTDDDDYLNFINLIKNRSIYNFNTNITIKDKILTLSTCYNNIDRLVLHAKLIKEN